MKKTLLALFLFAFLASTPAFAKDPYVEQAETWLAGLKTGQAHFIQKAYDGQVSEGTFYIWRPGRLRFEYDPPLKDFIVADGVLLYYYDAEQRQASTAPVGTTLADFFLRKRPKLEGDLTVSKIHVRGQQVAITVVQTSDPASGAITLNFTKNPFALKSWRILDAQGLETSITLEGLETGMALAPELFIFKDPSGKTKLNN